ncbi:virulence factor MviN, partial [Actinotignum timonense]|nr:virulence factor MviN [Actinotignum timonense]
GEGALGALGATGAAGALTLAIGGVALYLVDRRALRLARDAEAPSTQEMPAIAVALDEANT